MNPLISSPERLELVGQSVRNDLKIALYPSVVTTGKSDLRCVLCKKDLEVKYFAAVHDSALLEVTQRRSDPVGARFRSA